MIFGSEKEKQANLDKQLPPPPIDPDAPPPYVFYATTPSGDPLPPPPPQTNPFSSLSASKSASPSTPPPTPPAPTPTPSMRAPQQTPIPIPVSPSGPFMTPPANYISVTETHNAVKGSWTLDTSSAGPALSAVPSFLSNASSGSGSGAAARSLISLMFPSTTSARDGNGQGGGSGEGGTGAWQGAVEAKPSRPNLRLKSTHGKIDANVRVVRGTKESEPARIEVRSQHGSVKLSVPSRGAQRLSILAASPYGSIDIALPRSFIGLILHRTKYSKFSMSDDVAALATTFTMEAGVGSTFVGDWRGVDFSGLCPADDRGGGGEEESEKGLAEAMRIMAGAGNDGMVDIPGWPCDLLVMDSTYSKLKVSFAKPLK